jgi:hypothetical protein
VISVAVVRAAFAFEPGLCKGEAAMPLGQAAPMHRLKAIIAARLAELVDGVVAWAVAQLPAEKLAKESAPTYDFTDLLDSVTKQMVAAALAGTGDLAETFGVDLTTAPEVATAYARAKAAEMVGMKWVDGVLIDNPNARYAISEQLRGVVNDKVTQAIAEGWSPQQLASSLRADFEPWRAEAIARTETGLAYINASAEGYKELGVEMVEIVDGDGCLPHGHDDGAPLPSGEPGVIEEDAQANGQVWTVDQFQENPIGHPNCLPGRQMVVAPNATAMFARAYHGEVIVIRTAANDDISCTPNHPVLTTKGWMPARLIAEGDDVFRCLDPQRLASSLDPDHDHVPAPIEQVAGALLESSGVQSATMPAAPEYFHGDGAGGDVHVVVANGLRPDAVQPPGFEHALKVDFDCGSVESEALDSRRAAALLLNGLLPSTNGGVGCGDSPSPLFGSGTGRRKTCRLARRPQLESVASECGSNRRAVNPASVSDLVRVLSCEVIAVQEIVVSCGVLDDGVGLSASPDRDSGRMESASHELIADTERGADLPATLAALIEPSRVVKIERQLFAGHVFNLQTTQGWYVAGGIITHNCVRGAVPASPSKGESE